MYKQTIKVLFVIAVAIYGASAVLSSALVEEKWSNFKVSYNRSYVNAKEEAFRKQIFQHNLERFETHNERYRQGLETWTMGVNQFADMTKEEIKQWTHGLVKPEIIPKPLIEIRSRKDLGLDDKYQYPPSFDWRDKGMVTGVKNQGSCGSCWAFSTTGAIESQEKIAHGKNKDISVSEQQLVDCDKKDKGCSGGWMANAYIYIAENGGIDSESSYPYEAKDNNCRYKSDKVASRLKGYAYLTGPDEEVLADMVSSKGPSSVAIDADGDFAHYSSGVYYNPNCKSDKFTHAVLVVGYGRENNQDYWTVKNSWGSGWGQGGYIKMARKRNNNCGIASAASYPVLL